MEEQANKSLKMFFSCMSIAAVVISIRVKIVYSLSIDAVKAIWNTYLFLFGILPVFGVMAIFLSELKDYVHTKRERLFSFFDQITEKITGTGIIIGGGIGGTVTAMLLFEPTWKGVVMSWALMVMGFIITMIGLASKKFAEKFGEDAYEWSKKQTLKYAAKKEQKKDRKEKRA